MKLNRIAFVTAALGCTTAALANTSFFTAPAFRGASGGAFSTFSGWESYTVPVGAPGNFGDLAGSSPAAVLLQSDPLAAIISSGNLYNQNGKSVFQLQYNNAGGRLIDRIVLQTRTSGTELDYNAVLLSYNGLNVPANRTELERTAFGPPPGTPGSGFSVSSLYSWDLPDDYSGSFEIGFKAADVSLSFDAAMLDVAFVPEPSTWALLGVGGVVLGWVGRRGRR